MNNKVTFINEIIVGETISQWSDGDRILIEGGFGIGKTTWAIESLGNYAKENNKKVLLLQNRKSKIDQLATKIKREGLMEVVYLETYQNIERSIVGFCPKDLSDFDYIVWDEVHYAFLDSAFNKFTDLSFEHILSQGEKKINIFMSATPERFMKYIEKTQAYPPISYKIENNHNIIDKVYQFSSWEAKEAIIEKIIKSCVENKEKALIFINDLMELNYLHGKYSKHTNLKVGLATSKSSPLYCREVQDTIQHIEGNGYFEEDVLFSTNVLSTGITLLDEKLKYIMIDSYDLITIKQAIGRKRVRYDEKTNTFCHEDTIDVFIPIQSKGSLGQSIRRDEERIRVVNYLIANGGEQFSLRCTKNSFMEENGFPIKFSHSLIYRVLGDNPNKKDIITYNKIEYFNLLENLKDYTKREVTPHANASRLSNALKIPKSAIMYSEVNPQEVGSLVTETMDSGLEPFLKQYLEKKLFSESRREISHHIMNLMELGGKKMKGKFLRVSTMNKVLYEEFDLTYQFSEEIRETSGKDRGKRYNYLVKLSEEEILENRE